MPKKRRAMPGRRTAPDVEVQFPHPVVFFWGAKKVGKRCKRNLPSGFKMIQTVEDVTGRSPSANPGCSDLAFSDASSFGSLVKRKTSTFTACNLYAKLGPEPKAEGDTKLQCRSVSTAAATAKTARPMRGSGTSGTTFGGI